MISVVRTDFLFLKLYFVYKVNSTTLWISVKRCMHGCLRTDAAMKRKRSYFSSYEYKKARESFITNKEKKKEDIRNKIYKASER